MGPAPPSSAKIRGTWGGGNKKPCGCCVRGDTAGAPGGHPLIHVLPSQTGRRAQRGVLLVPLGPTAPGTRPPRARSPMMMVQALTSPISFLSATRSEAPGPGPGPGEGEGAGPGFPRPLGCCVWPAMSLSRRVPAPCAAPSVRPAARQPVRPAVGARRSRKPDSAHRRAHALARGPGPEPRPAGPREGRKEDRPAAPSPTFLKGNSPPWPPPSQRGPGRKERTWGRSRKNFLDPRRPRKKAWSGGGGAGLKGRTLPALKETEEAGKNNSRLCIETCCAPERPYSLNPGADP